MIEHTNKRVKLNGDLVVLRVRENGRFRDRFFVREDMDFECWREVKPQNQAEVKRLLDSHEKGE